MMVTPKQTIIGRAKTALVFGQDDDAQAIVATVVVRARRGTGRQRLVFAGRSVFVPQVVHHLAEEVLAVADEIARQLVPIQKRQTLEVSVINLGAASATGVGLSISGYSADTAVFLGVLSATLRLPLRQDTVSTGHLASTDGEVRPVRSIPAKIAAAVHDPAVRRFVCPYLDADTSLKTLSPVQRERAADAMAAAKGDLQIIPLTNVVELIKAATDDDALLEAGLRRGFFETIPSPDGDGSPIERAATFMGTGNDERFWRALDRYLFAGDSQAARALLLARSLYEMRRRRYPNDLGRRLFALVRSLPPTTRRNRGFFPLLPMERCLQMARFATDGDHPDIRYLLDATAGRMTEAKPEEQSTPLLPPSPPREAVSAVLAEISAETLARKIGLPIDSARAGFLMESVIIDSYEVFLDTVEAFYVALLRHSGSARVSAEEQTVRAKSIGLIEEAFARQGGTSAAWAEARDGVRGGMRFVLDVLTEQYKTEMQADHVTRVVKEAVDPLNWDDRVAFMEALMERLGPHLPPELRAEPAERFSRHYETILRTYVQSLDRVKELLRAM